MMRITKAEYHSIRLVMRLGAATDQLTIFLVAQFES